MPNMLTNLATADAYGAAFEFTKTPNIPNNLSRFGSHPTGGLAEGAFTDDTMRSMANAMVILEGHEFDRYRPEAYLQSMFAEFHDDRRLGWSSRFQEMLLDHHEGHPARMIRKLERRATNGCVMGVAPLGYLPNGDEVRTAAMMQTIATHSAAAVPYAQVVALAAHHLLNGGDTETVVTYAIEGAEWEGEAQMLRFRALLDDEPPVPAMPAQTIAAGALWALGNFDRLTDALIWTCSRGGDTDSLAAVTIALASCATDMEQDMPAHLINSVDTKDNRERLRHLDGRLEAMQKHRKDMT